MPSFRDTGDVRGLAQALIRLGKAAMYAGRVDYAAETWREALATGATWASGAGSCAA